MSIDRSTFFKAYNLEEGVLDKVGLVWADLEAIYADHLTNTQILESTADYIAARLRQVNEVHSLKIRIKDPEHLIEKIIRKKGDNPSLEFTLDNYREKITDVIGVRALHLFKEDWSEIHDFIEGTWKLHERPTANVRKGDPEEYTQQFVEKGCRINEHKFGYRSVHYLLVSQPAKEQYITEVQVRTIFEEGWSEIDHRIRYPYDLGNAVLMQLSAIHNRLAGSADEIGSFIKFLKRELRVRDEQITETVNKHEKAVAELNNYVQKLEISNKEKKELEARLKSFTGESRTPSVKGIVNFLEGLGKISAMVTASEQLAAERRDIIAKGIIAAAGARDIATTPTMPSMLTTAKTVPLTTASPTSTEANAQKDGLEQKTSSASDFNSNKKSQLRGRRRKAKLSKKVDEK
jgi:ppGpp synthetase/RelA/SpoT-type nucleotidyltranferase